jgi:hypothetical protein
MAMRGEQFVKLRACRHNSFSDSLRQRNWLALPIDFGANFRFFDPKIWEILEMCVFVV